MIRVTFRLYLPFLCELPVKNKDNRNKNKNININNNTNKNKKGAIIRTVIRIRSKYHLENKKNLGKTI